MDTSLGLGPECDGLGDRLTAHDGPGLPGRKKQYFSTQTNRELDGDIVYFQERPHRPPLYFSAEELLFPR